MSRPSRAESGSFYSPLSPLYSLLFRPLGEKAEEEGFEPSVPGTGTPVFETGPFNHSGTPPDLERPPWLGAAPERNR